MAYEGIRRHMQAYNMAGDQLLRTVIDKIMCSYVFAHPPNLWFRIGFPMVFTDFHGLDRREEALLLFAHNPK